MSSADLDPESGGISQDTHSAADSKKKPESTLPNNSSNSSGAVALEKEDTHLQQQSRTGIYGIALLSLIPSKAEPLIHLRHLQMKPLARKQS